MKIKVYRSHEKKIPDGINELTQRALDDGASDLFFIEEDTVPPEGVLKELLCAKEEVSFVDYSVAGWSCSMFEESRKEYIWCGLGCTMVKRSVFEKLYKPYFRTDKKFRLNDLVWLDIDRPEKAYVGHDIWFFLNSYKMGVKFKKIEGECRHLGLKSLGQSEINNGLHSIFEKQKIVKQQVINLSQYGGEL